MLLAGVLNSATSKTTVSSFVRISGTDGEVVLHHDRHPPNALRNLFARGVNCVERLRSAPPPSDGAAQTDLVSQLDRLASLHAGGHLTNKEFAAAKAAALAAAG